MRLLLTEYISSLKEDQELDKLVQDLLKADGFEIFTTPERGRQYGVDIYAVGPDKEDDNIKKVHLITVKQGDIDRRTWNNEVSSLRPSLDDITTVFIRNNLSFEHRNLPIKIVVAFNGRLKQGLQQDWRAYGERFPDYNLTLWNIDWLVNAANKKLFNEEAFSGEVRSLIHRSIIYFRDPDYDLRDFSRLLLLLREEFRIKKSARHKIKLIKQLHFILAIVVKYAELENNLKHALECSEKYILMLWQEIDALDDSRPYFGELFSALMNRTEVQLRYIKKLGRVAYVQDGFGRFAGDSVAYTYKVYEQLGILTLAGLEFLQLSEALSSSGDPHLNEVGSAYHAQSLDVLSMVLRCIENNSIFYSPREDSHLIEINLILILLKKLNRQDDLRTILQELHDQLAEGVILSNIFPVFDNNKRTVAELEVDYQKRLSYDYQSSNLLACLCEWTAVLGDEGLYRQYKLLKEKLLPSIDLILWCPLLETKESMFDCNAMDTGYSLSNITLPDSLTEFQSLTKTEFDENTFENEFSFMKSGFWVIGLIANRHFRTYTFPAYWRQFLS